MSGGFHVHGVHEHEIEHQAHQGNSFVQYIAIFTAILSSFAAVIGYFGSSVLNEALLLKNDAVIKQNQASDQWAFYQSKSSKQHLMELASELVPSKAGAYDSQLKRYKQEKDKIRQQAESLEQASIKDNEKSELLLEHHHLQSQSIMLLQIAISLASITALTRKKWLFGMAGLSATAGIVLAGFSWLFQ